MKNSFLFLIVVLAGFVFSIPAQEEEEKSPAALEGRAEALVEEILLELPQLESKENRITASTLIIDLIWPRDEKIARELALQTAASLNSELAPALEKDEQIRAFLLYPPSQYKELRADFLLKIVKYDAEFAEQLAASTAPLVLKLVPKSETERITIFNWNKEERDLEQRLAFKVAGKNIDEALVIARRSLKKDSSKESLNLLRRLQIRDAKSADAFADEIMQGLIAEDFKKDREAHETTAIFLGQLDPRSGVFGGMLDCNCPAPKALNLNPQRLRQLAGKWLDFALTLPDEKAGFFFLPVVALLEKLVPEKKPAIAAKIASIQKNAPRRFEYAQIEERVFDRETSPEALAKLALTKKGIERFHLYRQAFIKAANASKASLEKLLASVSEHPESEEKRWLTDEIAANMAGKTAEEGNLDSALEMSQKVTKRDRRLGLLSFLAVEFRKKGENEKAKLIADEIAVLLDLKTKDKMPKAIVSYDIFSTLFHTFALTDAGRAFDLVETSLPTADESFFNAFPNLKTLINRHAYALSSYSKSIRRLAESDFQRTKRLTLYFKRPELALFGKFLIAQAVLNEKFEWGNVADRNEMIILGN